MKSGCEKPGTEPRLDGAGGGREEEGERVLVVRVSLLPTCAGATHCPGTAGAWMLKQHLIYGSTSLR